MSEASEFFLNELIEDKKEKYEKELSVKKNLAEKLYEEIFDLTGEKSRI